MSDLNQTLANDASVNHALDVLDLRERRFVLQATIGRLSQSAAAADAGFKAAPKSKAVTYALQVVQTTMAKELSIDADFVQRGFFDAVQMARTNGEPMTMIAGYREMGKLAGLYVEKKEINVNVRHLTDDQLHELTDDELDNMITRADAIELEKNERGEFEVPTNG
jgi:histidyl-tRNA synthetase